MPIYNIDLERESGFPSQAVEFVEEVERAEAIIISLAEHNGMYTAAFKNILDWASRINRNMWNNKSLLFLSTSTGKRGAVTVLNLAVEHFHRMGASKIESFSLPLYYSNFDSQEGIIDQELSHKFDISLKNFINTITQEARRTDRQIEQSV